jgi:hypothetical protein
MNLPPLHHSGGPRHATDINDSQYEILLDFMACGVVCDGAYAGEQSERTNGG